MGFYCRYIGIQTNQHFRLLLKELFRKSIHICTAFVPLLLHHNKFVTLLLLFSALCLYVLFETLRHNGKKIPFVSAITAAAARKRDENKFVLGPVTLVVGVILTSIFFDLNAATAGILSLAFGDGLASLSGKFFGRIYIPLTGGKTVFGSITCFTAILLSTFAVTGDIRTALIAAITGMTIEMLPLKDFDNVFIPIAIATVVMLNT